MNNNNQPSYRYALATIALVSCSMLMFEILLTRIAALRMIFHFSFLVVSNCMLGIGASGTFIALFQQRFRRAPRFWVGIFTALYLVSLIGTYMFLIRFHLQGQIVDVYSKETLRFVFYMFVGALPLFFGGSVIGLILTCYSDQVNKLYASDLLGAGVGCLLCPMFLAMSGAGGCLMILITIGLVGAYFAIDPSVGRGRLVRIATIALCIGAIALFPYLDRAFPVSGKNDLQLTQQEHVRNIRANTLFSKWSAISRIDVINLDPNHPLLFCLGDKTLERLSSPNPEVALPEQKMIVQDCVAGTIITNFGEHPEALKYIDESLYAMSASLLDSPRVFIIGAGGGNDIWGVKRGGASYVKAIELNKQILEVHRKALPGYSRPLVDDPNIELVYGEGRSAIMRETEQYDLFQMTGIDTWTGLSSGAYVLAENYLYTTDALESMLSHVRPGGLMQITRMAADMETLRMLVNIHSVFQDHPGLSLEKSVALVKTYEPLMAIIVKNGEFTPGEIEKLEAYINRGGIEPVYLPGRELGTVVEDFINTPDKDRFIREFPRNITPTTDDKPYFFNFTRWRNPLAAKETIFEPTNVSQGNPLFLFLQLGLSTTAAFVLIILPVLAFMRRGIERTHMGRVLLYFAALGLGFIWLEMAAMQKLTLFLGHPLYSITVTLFTMLVFTGFGSMFSGWFHGRGAQIWLVPGGLAVTVVLFLILTPMVESSLIALPFLVRAGITVGLLAPISFLLGIPFAFGVRMLNHHNPTLIPLAWAVNGTLSVVGSILIVILSMNFGFTFMLIASVAVYLVGFAAIRRLAY